MMDLLQMNLTLLHQMVVMYQQSPKHNQFRKLKRQNSSLNGSRRRQRKASSSVVLRMGLPWQVMHSSQMTAPSAGS